MRVTFYTSTTETLAYLKTVNSVMEHNKAVTDEVKAYNDLKRLVLSLNKRLNELEASARRNKVCR